jgi:hypothetical protein
VMCICSISGHTAGLSHGPNFFVTSVYKLNWLSVPAAGVCLHIPTLPVNLRLGTSKVVPVSVPFLAS